MKKRIIVLTIAAVLTLGILCSCGKKEENNVQPDEVQIQNVCKLATLECYYHNVAKIDKDNNADHTIIDFLKRDRKAWIEYTGVAKIGIDFSKVKMTVDSDTVEITIPEAELLDLNIDESSLTEDSYYLSEDDWLVKNQITADLQSEAIQTAQDKMEEEILANTSLMKNAQNKAQTLIKNYIDMLSEQAGKTYNVVWIYEDGSKEEAEETTAAESAEETEK